MKVMRLWMILTVVPLLFLGCLNQTDGYTGTYLLPDPAQSNSTSSTSGSGAVGVPPAPANAVSAPCQVNDGTNYRGYWNGLEMDTCATTNFKARLQERIRNPHRVVYYTSTSQFPKPVGFSNLPTGFSNPPTSEATQKSLSISYMQDMTQWVVPQWNTWHTFVAIALLGINPGNAAGTYSAPAGCATDTIYDYYGATCMAPPGAGYPSGTKYPRLFNSDTTLRNNEGSNATGDSLTYYTREHSWPKSWFDAGTTVNNPSAGSYCYNGNSDASYGAKAYDYRAFVDQHHLRPTQQNANNSRSNNAFGIVNAIVDTYAGNGGSSNPKGPVGSADSRASLITAGNPVTGGKRGTPHFANIQTAAGAVTGVGTFCASISATVCPTTGTCTASNNSGCPETCVPPSATSVWEPPDHVKGNMARNYFYMSTRYYTEDTCWVTSDGTNKAHIKLWMQCLLLKWHQQDPPDAQEVALNDLIHRIQGNRNPFVDHPEWVASVINNGGF